MDREWTVGHCRLDIIVEAAAILKRKGLRARIQLAGSVMPHIPESRIYYELLQSMIAVSLLYLISLLIIVFL